MKRNVMFINICFIAGILIITSSFTNTKAANFDYKLLNKQTVKIKADNEIGSGVLLCQKDDKINILTAKHIFKGQGDEPIEDEPIEVVFYEDYCKSINLSKKELNVKLSRILDIAVLQIQVNKDRSCPLEFIQIGTSKNIGFGQEVYTTGHPVGESENDWDLQPGIINRAIGEYIPHSCRITKGYSGGPLVNVRGELIGINVVEERGVGQAIPIDSILPLLREYSIFTPVLSSEQTPQVVNEPLDSGMKLYNQGKYDAAAVKLREAVKIDPKNSSAYASLGYALEQTGNYPRAVTANQRAIELDPDNTFAHWNLGNALYALKQYEDAAASHRAALKISPDYVNAYYGLGNALSKLGREQEAQEAFAMARDPSKRP